MFSRPLQFWCSAMVLMVFCFSGVADTFRANERGGLFLDPLFGFQVETVEKTHIYSLALSLSACAWFCSSSRQGLFIHDLATTVIYRRFSQGMRQLHILFVSDGDWVARISFQGHITARPNGYVFFGSWYFLLVVASKGKSKGTPHFVLRV